MDLLKNKIYKRMITKLYFDIRSGKISEAKLVSMFKALFPMQYKAGQINRILAYAREIKQNLVSLDDFYLEIDKYYNDKVNFEAKIKKLR